MLNKDETGSEVFNLKEFILAALSFKYLYIASTFICLTVGFALTQLIPTVYEVNSIIGPTEDKSTSLLSSDNLFKSFGALSRVKSLEDDINSLNSFTLVASTLNSLNLEVGYYMKKNKIFSKTTQIYNDPPFIVSIDKTHPQAIDIKFKIRILNDNSFQLTGNGERTRLYNYIDNQIISKDNSINIDTICKFNETIDNRNFKFSVSLNKNSLAVLNKGENKLYFELYHLDELTKQFLKKLKISQISSNSSLINIRIEGRNIQLIIEFLNKFLQDFLDENLAKKNKISVNTIKFIDSQISEISDSLTLSESKLRDYRSTYKVMDLSYQGQKALEQMNDMESQRSNLQIQERYYNYILDYFKKNQDISGLAPPSSANVTDDIMNKLILDLLALNADKSSISSSGSGKNLFLAQIENKIKLQKQAIIENVTNNLNTLNLTLNELNYRTEKLSKDISTLPRTELNMVSMQRKFNLSDAIYTYLLQKRSEAAITMASNFPDFEILEPAREITKEIISPKKFKIMALSLFIALVFSTFFVVIKEFFNEKIAGVSDIEHILKRPIINVIYRSRYKSEQVVKDYPGSSVAESFRNLRSTLFLKLKSEPEKIILLTSTQPQDGKSFISFNLALSIASVGHKTIILDCDLRRPTLHEKFKVENKDGISNYLTKDISLDKIILQTSNENLSLILAGPTLPNPTELIESGLLDELISYLKKNYDYIIIDTTPAGLVADALLMMRYSTYNLLVVRNNYTRKEILSEIVTMLKTNEIKNFDIVFNDLNIKDSRYSRYNSYYKQE